MACLTGVPSSARCQWDNCLEGYVCDCYSCKIQICSEHSEGGFEIQLMQNYNLAEGVEFGYSLCPTCLGRLKDVTEEEIRDLYWSYLEKRLEET